MAAEFIGETAAQWFLEQLFDEVKSRVATMLLEEGEKQGSHALTAIGGFLEADRDYFAKKLRKYELNKLEMAQLHLKSAMITLFQELARNPRRLDSIEDETYYGTSELHDALDSLQTATNNTTIDGWSSVDRRNGFKTEIEDANRKAVDAFVTINQDLRAKMQALKILLFCKVCIHKHGWPQQWNMLLGEFLQRRDVQKAWNKVKNPETNHESFMRWVKEKLPKSLSQSDKEKKLQVQEELFCLFMNINRILGKVGFTPPKVIEMSEEPEGNTDLFQALSTRLPEKVRTALSNNRNVNVVDDIGRTPLLHAIEYGLPVGCIKCLISSGADVNQEVFRLRPLLWTVVYENEDAASELVDVLRQKGIEDDALDSRNRTVLHFAAEFERAKMIKWLVEKKSLDINMVDSNYKTSLCTAVDYNNEEEVRIISELGGSVAEICGTGVPSLELFRLAAVRGYSNIRNMLLECSWFEVTSTTLIDKWNALHVASHLGDVNLAKRLIERNVDIVGRTDEGETPMHLAARHGHREALKVLLEGYEEIRSKTQKGPEMTLEGQKVEEDEINIKSPEISERPKEEENADEEDSYAKSDEYKFNDDDALLTYSGATLLHYAARGNDMDTIIFLLEKGFAADREDSGQETPLVLAIENKNTEAVRRMLDHLGNKATGQLLRCAVHGNKEILELLHQIGFDIDMCYSDGLTLLDMTAKLGNTEAAEWLISKGAKMETPTDGYTALHHAAGNSYDNVAIIRLLYDKGFDVNAKTNNGRTPLHLAASAGNAKITIKLINLGADVDATDLDGNSALHCAACKTKAFAGDARTIKVILQKRPDLVDVRNRSNCTPLHHAAKSGNDEGIVMLLKNGADLHAVDDQGQNALHYATFPFSYLFFEPKIITLLIGKGIEKNSRTNNGCTPLHEAARQGNTKAMEELKAMDFDFEAVDNNGNNAIHYAVYGSGDPKTLKLLKGYGIDVNARNGVKSAPLHEAAHHGKATVVKELIALGADQQVENEEGKTPLDYAVDQEIVNLFTAVM